jgi:hypothetical protein
MRSSKVLALYADADRHITQCGRPDVIALHPNAAGYAVMGPLAERAVAAALRKQR